MRGAPRLCVELGRSSALGAGLAAIHVAAAAALGLSGLSGLAQMLGIGALAASLARGWRLHVTRTAASAVRVIRIGREAPAEIELRSGEVRAFERVDAALPLSGLVVLRMRPAAFGRGCSVVVPADAVDPDVHRRLRILLRWGDAPSAQAADPPP